jgi:hypothetical protein
MKKMTEDFGDRFVYEEWNQLFNAMFALSEDDEDHAATTRLVEDAMDQVGIFFPETHCHQQPAESSSRTVRTRRSRHPAKKRPRTASIFLDINAEEDDGEENEEEDDEDDEEDRDCRRRLPSLEPAGHAAYAQRLAEVVERYETGNSGSRAGPAPHPTTSDLPSNLVLLNDDGQRVYTVTFPTSTFFENNTVLLFLHTL